MSRAWRPRGGGSQPTAGREARHRRQGQQAGASAAASERSPCTSSTCSSSIPGSRPRTGRLDPSRLPSWPEGLGRVVIEAFARGRGVIATDAGGIPDLVTNGQGILIPPADEDALVDSRSLSSATASSQTLGAAAHLRYADWHSTPAEFAAAYRDSSIDSSRLSVDAPDLRHPGDRRRPSRSRPHARPGRGSRGSLGRGRRAVRERGAPLPSSERPDPVVRGPVAASDAESLSRAGPPASRSPRRRPDAVCRTWCRSSRFSPPRLRSYGAYGSSSGTRTGASSRELRVATGWPMSCSVPTSAPFPCGRRRSEESGTRSTVAGLLLRRIGARRGAAAADRSGPLCDREGVSDGPLKDS